MMQGGAPGEPRVSNYAYTSCDGGLTWKREPGAQRETAAYRATTRWCSGATAPRITPTFHSTASASSDRTAPGAASSCARRATARSWTTPVAVVDHVNTAIPFEDKPWLGVDRGASSPHRGNVYVAWTRFDVYGSEDPAHRSRIMFSRSRDGGAHVFDAARDFGRDGRRAGQRRHRRGSGAGRGSERRRVYRVGRARRASYSTSRPMAAGRSARTSWSAPMPGGWDSPVPGLERHNGMPVTAVDLSEGARQRARSTSTGSTSGNGDLDVLRRRIEGQRRALGRRRSGSTTMPKGRRRCSRG